MARAASRREILGVILAGSGGLVLSLAGCRGAPVTVHLVRHAEKQEPEPGAKPPPDPSLSEKGRRRSEMLVTALAGVTLGAVFASQFKRTQETVAPVAAAHGLKVETVDADDVRGLVARIRAHAGGEVLVAGHSNTVPAIATALGVAEPLVLAESDYGDLFLVRSSGSSATLERRRFEAG
jgi:broad specificity phosphatase PhoE